MNRSAAQKYRQVFGYYDTLATAESWTTGLSNMLEWLTWSTDNVLGVTKSTYTKRIVEWCHEKRSSSAESMLAHVTARLKDEVERSDVSERYAPTKSTIASAREALRRSKYFSEDYLNKEFDIFWTLASDTYLDAFYGQFTRIRGGGHWSTHGNSGLFEYSTRIKSMQMDNLSYNEQEGLLVANELKLGGKKNGDQILKYALMYSMLRERGFITPATRFLLLFISDKAAAFDKDRLIAEEIDFCRKAGKSTTLAASAPEIVAHAKRAEYGCTTWGKIMGFNTEYMARLDPTTQQVERKLLWGFNETLSLKKFLQD